MTRDILAERRKSLEESFFRRRNIELMERLRQQLELEAKRTEFAMVSGIKDEKLLDRLISLEMTSATVAALALVPMVRVAWADGSLEAKERDAILQAAVDCGLSKESAGYHWLSSWLEHQPETELTNAWREYVAALKETLSDDDREALKNGLIDRAQQVAESAGGFLGLVAQVSTEEQAILDELRAAFTQQLPLMPYVYDIIVVGAGHAGTEAALAAARMGARVALLTANLDTVGQMSCNPAIGGVAKGQIAREIDAMGGAMGQAIDATGIQFRMLNRRKGPAMHSPRAQADKKAYQIEIKRLVESQPGLDLRQETVEDLLTEQTKAARIRAIGVAVRGGATYTAEALVLTTGTFLQAVMHTGESKTPGGRAGEGTTAGISGALQRLGFRLSRFKTGTPPRLNGRSIDFSECEVQPGDEQPQPFSYLTDRVVLEQLPCWITYTNEAAHELIRRNLHRAPMYSGQINTTGPRYCPSIEDKVVRFADKSRHQIFLEPEGRDTHEFYVNGVSTSLPRDVQDEIFKHVPGLRHAQIMRYGYAVEYDFVPPDQLRSSLETKSIQGLFFAGQLNGTTGYEEAAAQGLIAGANAALSLQTRDPIVLGREQSYVGVLIDDLVTCGVDEPYRMFTSRAEYRLRLRQDNADRRLTPLAANYGLVKQNRIKRLEAKQVAIEASTAILESRRHEGVPLIKWLRRPEVDWDQITAWAPELGGLSYDVVNQVICDAKYAGYVAREDTRIERQKRLGAKTIPDRFDYSRVRHLRHEALEKLLRVRPTSLDQAGRISGITPADIALLMAYIEAGRG